MSYIFPLYSAIAEETIAITATTKEIEVNSRLIKLTVAASITGVATLAQVPVGVVFTLRATSVGGSSTITITTKAGKTIAFDTANETVTLMSIENDDFTVMDAVGVVGNAASGVVITG
jgi:hypothetical protein